MSKHKIIFLFIFLSMIASCSKNNNTNWIPYVPVNIDIYPANPQYIDLYPVGGWIYHTGGSRGLIIYHFSQDEYYAFDQHCPYQPTNSCGTVRMETDDITAVDTCCGSQFIITDGSVIQGPAGLPLKQYQTYYDGTTLHITN